MTDIERKALVATLYDFSFRFGGLTFFGFKEGEMPAGIDRAAQQIKEDGQRIETQAREIERLRKAGHSILPYLEWTLSPESPGYHPTLPSAVYELRAALGESHDQ